MAKKRGGKREGAGRPKGKRLDIAESYSFSCRRSQHKFIKAIIEVLKKFTPEKLKAFLEELLERQEK